MVSRIDGRVSLILTMHVVAGETIQTGSQAEP